MAYLGSEAYRLEQWEQPEHLDEQNARARSARRFRPIEGGGLDAEARKGVTPQFWLVVKTALVVLAAALALASAHVAVRAATVSLMAQNNTLSSEISEVEEENRDLQVTRSVLSSKERIARIATQNYGMVLTTPSATIYLDSQE